jgi:hypothetical protein
MLQDLVNSSDGVAFLGNRLRVARSPSYGIRCSTVISDISFDVFTAVTMNNAVFWNVTSCCPCKNRRFGRVEPPSSGSQESVPY